MAAARLYRRRRGRTAPGKSSADSVAGDSTSITPALPHERDESSSSQQGPENPGQREPIRQAYEDVVSGQVDTDERNRVGEILVNAAPDSVEVAPTHVDPTQSAAPEPSHTAIDQAAEKKHR